MIFTTEMTQLFAVVLARDSRKLTEVLLEQGCMQFVKTAEFGEQAADDGEDLNYSVAEITELRKRIEGFLHTANIIPNVDPDIDISNRVDVDIKKENARLDQIAAERQGIRDKQRVIHQEIIKLEDIKRQMDLYGSNISDMKMPAQNSLISMQIGKLAMANVDQLEKSLKGVLAFSAPIAVEDNISHRLVISMKRDKAEIAKILARVGWAEVEFPKKLGSVGKNVSDEMTAKLEKLDSEREKLEAKAKGIVEAEAGRLQQVWVNLWVNELLGKIQTNFEASSKTLLFTGWLPLSKKKVLIKKITEACEGRCYLEWSEAKCEAGVDVEVPVELKNPKVLAPFQMLVSNFGVPEYGTIDPTTVVMPLYLSMFGLMFADIGQGLVLAVLGILGARSFKSDKKKEGLYNLSWLIIWCGIASTVFGALFGSFFGMSIVRPIWFDFHGIVAGHSDGSSVISSVYDILAITIYFGITVIFIGLAFNWINMIKTKKWDELVFDKGGILGGWIYGGGIYMTFYFVRHEYKEFPPSGVLFMLVGLPALLLFIKEPYHFFKHKKADEKFNIFKVLNFLMFWIVELLEVFSGYLSNTLSFMRVAGLGIAHVCLMISFFTLAEMTSGIGSIIILVLGNILVIGLEGLSAGIQALRLSYYEFFTKFFHGTGKLYTPISLNSKFK